MFVRVTGGEVLYKGLLRQGEERRYDNPRLDLVVYDASAVEVVVNGVPRKRGLPGQRRTYQVKKTLGTR